MTMLTDHREQIRQFKAEIYNAGIASKQEIFKNEDLVEQSLKLAKEGMSVHLSNVKPVAGTSFIEVTPAYNPVDGRPVTRVTHDAMEIFKAEYSTRKNREEQERKQLEQLRQKNELEWFRFDSGASVADRYDIPRGQYITKEYFFDNPYRCQHSSCNRRFKTQEEANKHYSRTHQCRQARYI